MYQIAAGTGFRANEIRSLTPENFLLDRDDPVVRVNAAYAKDRKEVDQPIRQDLALLLSNWLKGKTAGLPVFPKLTKHTNLLIRGDLARAGIAYRDSSKLKLVADFHSLRHTYVTMVVQSGATVKACQTLARHSTPVLTIGRYAKASSEELRGAMDRLPSTLDERSTVKTGPQGLATHLPLPGDGSGRDMADADAIPNGGELQALDEWKGCKALSEAELDALCRLLAVTDGTEGVGFEPTVGLTLLRFSRPSQSATLAPLLGSNELQTISDPLRR